MLAKLTLIIVVTSFFCVSATSQERCQKAANEAPTIFKLKLGMTFEQMQGILGPAFKFKPKKSGEGSYFANFIDRPSPNSLDGVRAAYLRFFDRKLYQIEIFYEDNGKNVRLEEFINRISPELGVQTSSWKIVNGTAGIDCAGFSIKADAPLNPRVRMTDTAAEEEFEKKLKDRKQASKARS